MHTCTTCDHKLGSMAETCPHCGQPTMGKLINSWVNWLFLAGAFALLVIAFTTP